MNDKDKQKQDIIELWKQNWTYRDISHNINKKYLTEHWDNERTREVIRAYRRFEEKQKFASIIVPQKNIPQKIDLKKKKIMVMTDWHFPVHREDIVENINKHKNEISAFIMAGDAIDFDSISRFMNIGKNTLEQEIIDFYNYVRQARCALPIEIPMIFIMGNHEKRLWKYIANMHEKNLQKFINPHVLSMIAEGFTIYNDNKKIVYDGIPNMTYIPNWYCSINDLIVAHPEEYSKVQVRKAVDAIDFFIARNESFSTVLIGHLHRYGETIKNGKWGAQLGCLCKPQGYMNTGKFNYTPQDYGYAIIQFDQYGKVEKNESRIYLLDELYPINEDINYKIKI